MLPNSNGNWPTFGTWRQTDDEYDETDDFKRVPLKMGQWGGGKGRVVLLTTFGSHFAVLIVDGNSLRTGPLSSTVDNFEGSLCGANCRWK